MAVQTCLRGQRTSKIDTGSWTSLFPQDVGTKEDSLLFVKKLLAVSVSNIMYLRAAFPESAYVNRNLDGLPLKILNGKSDCAESRDLCAMVRAATDAIDKTYLREMVVAIYQDPERPEDAIETYTFHFEYKVVDDDKGGGGVDVVVGLGDAKPLSMLKMKDNVYKSTVGLIRQAVQVTRTLQPLPENCFLTVKLTYYDERTPEDYEPPGFNASDTDFKCDSEFDPIITTKVNTKYHGFHIQIRSREFKEQPQDDEEAMDDDEESSEVMGVGGTQMEAAESTTDEAQDVTTMDEDRKKTSVGKRMKV